MRLTEENIERLNFALEKQEEKFKSFPIANNHQSLSILIEEVGEFAKAINQETLVDAMIEGTHIAAVIIAWMQGELRNGNIK